ncbi:DegT/DnrJ/EryC1/StrS family aminotransferase [Billgrantia lactosivorans]|uniref:DegT/DnrJ/EryC1/StrS family aminotransferase n=1 Tax=Billgrantia lactosivorans TaxID=2185141 RepID=UPI000DAF202D|nr:DegT/DnrJ/EryC1/StrS family aminotransferase [Halomonas lactosivorans]
MIPVTHPYLPHRDKYDKYVDRIYSSRHLTNNAPLVKELTFRLEEYLGVKNLLLVANGTLALQVAYKALGLGAFGAYQEAVTTPFSFVATSSSIKWQGIQPVYSDIDENTWCLDPDKVEESIGVNTRVLVPVHVYGNVCDVDRLDIVAKRHGLKIVYDGAHAFGVDYQGTSVFSCGDAATLSFHATKLFHTIEGGGIVFKSKDCLEKARAIINFGLSEDAGVTSLGINCKMNEFQAAMGLCVLDDMDAIIERRKEITFKYSFSLDGWVGLQSFNINCTRNYAYFPILLESESALVRVKNSLEDKGVFPRRYFFPPLDSFAEFSLGEARSVIAGSISSRVLCLPLYPDLSIHVVEDICELVKKALVK